MTVRELYNYAISHSLLNNQVDDVLAIYDNKETSLNTPIQSNNLSEPNNLLDNDILNKVEWSIEDVLWLFSN